MLKQLLLSAKIGDGCYYKGRSNVNYNLGFVQKGLDYITHKKNVLEQSGLKTGELRKVYSGYKKDAFSYNFWTRADKIFTEIAEMPLKNILAELDKQGLIYYYLDDGSYHKSKNTLHLYCNTFTDEEALYLADIIYKLYPIKKCSLYHDRKKDGRCFPYLYIPFVTAKEFLKDVKEFLVSNNINSMLYKVGLPPQTIESIESL